MLNKKSYKTILDYGHKPRSRRELIGQGIIGGTASIFSPSIMSLLFSHTARASDVVCSSHDNSKKSIPVLVIDLAGGANLVGSEVMVGKRGGQDDFLASYATLGLPEGMSPKNQAPNAEFGLSFHPDSAILRGIKSIITESSIISNVDGVVFCTASMDDNANNPHNPAHWLAHAGASGEIATLIGTRATATGGFASAPLTSIDPSQRPITINSVNDITNFIQPGRIATILNDEKALEKILAATRTMTASQLKKFDKKHISSQLSDLIECGYLGSIELVSKFDIDDIDPRKDSLVNQLFNFLEGAPESGFPPGAVNNQTPAAAESQFGTVCKLILDQYAGVATVTMDGFDYHVGNRATGEQKNFTVGVMIGKAIKLASLKKRDLMIYVYTDGGVAANTTVDSNPEARGKLAWAQDDGQRSAAFSLLYKSDGKPQIRNNRRQIGCYKDDGSVEQNENLISTNVENLTKAVVANYLALTGREDQLGAVIGDDPFGANLDKYLAYTKLR